MKKGTFLSVLSINLILVVATIVLMGTLPEPLSAQPKSFVWKCQSIYSQGDLTWSINLAILKKMIETETKGRIKLELFPPGTITPVKEQFDALNRGIIDIGLSQADTDFGVIPESILVNGFPRCWPNLEQAYQLIYEHGLLEIVREAFAERNLYYLAPSPCGGLAIQTNFPFRTLADFKGKKIRGGGAKAELAKALGASSVFIPAPELYMAMKLGTIDGFYFTVMELESMKYKEVVKYVMEPYVWNPGGVYYAINMNRWKELPDDLKEAVNRAGRAQYLVSGRDNDMEAEKAITKAKEYGVKFVRLPPTDIEKMSEIGERVIWKPWADQWPKIKKGMDILKKYSKW